MVLKKLKQFFSSPSFQEEQLRYEALHHKYSKVSLENKKLKEQHEKNLNQYRNKLQEKTALNLIKVYQLMQDTRTQSFHIEATSPELQRLLMNINLEDKEMKKLLTKFSIEEIKATQTYFDPSLHEITSYEKVKKNEKPGKILRTIKTGFLYKGERIIKPKVIITK